MSSDDTTKNLPTEDKLDSLIALVQQIAGDVNGLVIRVGSLESQLQQVASDVKGLTTRVGQLESQLQALDQKVDARLQDTRPIWEAVQSQIAEMNVKIETGFHNVERRIDVVSVDINKMRADLRFLETRMNNLEKAS